MTGPVLGFRFWFARDDGLYPLRGRTATALPWLPGVNDASCRSAGHAEPPPGDTCGCGLHSFYEPEFMLRWLALSPLWEIRHGHPRGALVFGVTRSWGRMAAGRQSLAAQHAEVLALLDSPELGVLSRDDVRRLARGYDISVVPHASALVWASEFGSVMPGELRPAHP